MEQNTSVADKKIVLVVEDDGSLRNALFDKLKLKGFFPVEARNGEEGLQFALRDRPDLILLDILMPDMDGITMMKKLRATDTWGKQVPIILLTNLSSDNEEITKAVSEGGPVQFLIKSDLTIDAVLEKVSEQLSK